MNRQNVAVSTLVGFSLFNQDRIGGTKGNSLESTSRFDSVQTTNPQNLTLNVKKSGTELQAEKSIISSLKSTHIIFNDHSNEVNTKPVLLQSYDISKMVKPSKVKPPCDNNVMK